MDYNIFCAFIACDSSHMQCRVYLLFIALNGKQIKKQINNNNNNITWETGCFVEAVSSGQQCDMDASENMVVVVMDVPAAQ